MNYFKTITLFGMLSALLIVVGYLLGGSNGAIIFLFVSVLINLGTYWFSDKIALSMSGARQISREVAPQLFSVVEDLSNRMNIPTPKIYISPSSQANAFATGRGPSNSSVCFTEGILRLLPEEELSGVIAHELAHIKNRDVLSATVAATIAGAISALTEIAMWGSLFGGGDDDNNTNPLVSILLIILAPIAALIIQLAISRRREYAADEMAARVTRQPEGLANALVRIEESVKVNPMQVNPAMASLYIQNPFRAKGILELFSTHPATEKRVQALMNLNI